MSEHVDCVIVGGGITGLTCARTLAASGFDAFRLVTDELGGRIKASPAGGANMGAYYVRRDYAEVLRLAERGRRIPLSRISFEVDGRTLRVTDMALRHPLLVARFLRELVRYDRHYQRLAARFPEACQKTVMESDPYFLGLYRQPCGAWLREVGLEALAPYFEAIVRGTTICTLAEASAAVCLNSFLIALYGAYEYRLDLAAAARPLAGRTTLARVTRVEPRGDGWALATESGHELACDFLVLALPMAALNALVDTGHAEQGRVTVHCWHLRGEPRAPYAGRHWHVFDARGDDVCFGRQSDGTYIFYSKRRDAELERYFARPETLAFHTWAPAFNVSTDLFAMRRRDNLLCLTDYNVTGLEDAARIGKYGARVVLERQRGGAGRRAARRDAAAG
jgi:glycine/D-amino acid oxidase-like deaminating enzyme